MKKRLFALAVVALLVATALLAAGCGGGGEMKMLSGRWQLMTEGDANGQNQQQYPLPVTVNIYPDGRVEMWDSPLGKYTKSGNTFKFVSDDGTMNESGSYTLGTTKDQNTGNTVPTLTIVLDNAPASYVFNKQADLGPLESYLRSKAAATSAPPAAPATATPAK